jgi:glycosyltransferase involved in cell wall biosynthesis
LSPKFSFLILEILALVTYSFLFLRFVITLINYIAKPLLPVIQQTSYTDKISILVPARNEALSLPLLLASIDKQMYSNYELLILDDASADSTADVVAAYAAVNTRCRLLTGKALPGGWLGKNWACHQLACQARGKYLLFIDADVQLQQNFIASALHQMKSHNLALLSVFNDQIMCSWGEKLVVPLMHYLLLSLLPLRLVYRSQDARVAAASGQCMLFDAQVYRKYLFHQEHSREVAEDLQIMRSVKSKGLKGSALLANGQIRCRMYRSYAESIEGFSKNLIAGFSKNAWLCTLVIGLCTAGFAAFLYPLSFVEVLPQTAKQLFFLSVIIYSISIRIMVSLLGNQPVLANIVLHPLQMVSFIILLCTALYRHFTNTNRWKGRLVLTR